MDIRYVTYCDSQMAAACLCLALRMKGEGQWDDTMVHYTGYDMESLKPLMTLLNDMLVTPPYKQLSTIRSKYSHPYVMLYIYICLRDVNIWIN
jgi:hypothetical protein